MERARENKMNCPICELKVEEFDQPDESVRAVCCKCRILITINALPDEEVCQNDSDHV